MIRYVPLPYLDIYQFGVRYGTYLPTNGRFVPGTGWYQPNRIKHIFHLISMYGTVPYVRVPGTGIGLRTFWRTYETYLPVRALFTDALNCWILIISKLFHEA